MKDHLIFDTTNITTISDTDNIGAYVRSGKSGALVTHQSAIRAAPTGFSFVDGDVTVGSDSILEAGHGLVTGDKVQLTTSGTLPAGLALATDYYVIRVDANNFKLASSAYNAEWDMPVDITAAAGGGTHNVVGQAQDVRALDVWVRNPLTISGTVTANQGTSPWVVSATDLDIRDLVHTQDSIRLGDGTSFFTSTSENSDIALDVHISNTEIAVIQGSDSPWSIDDNGGSITVDGTVATNAEKAEDAIHASGAIGNFVLAVRNDANTALAADGDYTPFTTDAQGRLKVAAEVTVQAGDAEFLEDSIHNNADAGIHILAVRQDTLSSLVSADGDYASLKVNADGRLYVDVGTISINDVALANVAIAAAAETLDAANTAQNIIVSPLASRKYLWIYNKDNQAMFIGQSGVTAANGFPISPGAYMELRAGAAVDIEFVSSKLNHEIRTLEIS